MGEKKKYNLETMAGIGKDFNVAGRKYKILPVNISDMIYIIGTGNEEVEKNVTRLVILTKEELEKNNNNWQLFGLNITDPKRKEIFLKIINKYVYYLDEPMTEELLIEHNWSFKEIGEFLLKWSQISD